MGKARARRLGAAVLLGLLAALSVTANGAEFPAKPITIVVAFPPGGVDQVGRAMQAELARALKVEIAISNRPGATGTTGTAEVAGAPPDGYTLLLSPQGPLAYQPHIRSVAYGAASFAPICRLTETPSVLMASEKSGLKTVADLLAAAKAAPGRVSYASAGEGGLPHVGMSAFSRVAGVEMRHLPRKGAGDAIDALVAGEADLLAEQVPLAAARVGAGGLRVIAAFAAQRIAAFPDVPTMKEQGYDLSFSAWNVLVAPAGTPAAVIDTLDKACAAALAAPATVEAMQSRLRTPPAYLGPAATAAFIRSEVARGKELVEASGLKR
ncbi:MAG: tripartite tricarboxylate transporter substrate binding protein [Candidatus Methylomirabilales bacterium]